MSNSVQVVNKIQKLRKTAQLEPTDLIDVYYKPVDDGSSKLEEILQSQASQISQIKFLVSETPFTKTMIIVCRISILGKCLVIL
jgi:isoleucyl-tRNA synthetase